MKKFNPEMKVVRFGNEDVIVTSGAPSGFNNGDIVTFSGIGDGVAGNNYITLNGNSHLIDSTTLTTLGATGSEKLQSPVEKNANKFSTLSNLFETAETTSNLWNTRTYTYNSSENKFYWKQ